jgi:hypothetical protein
MVMKMIADRSREHAGYLPISLGDTSMYETEPMWEEDSQKLPE